MVPGGFRVSLLALKAAGELFELEARVVVVKLTAKRWEFRVMPAAHIVQPKVPKPPRRSAGAANRTCAFMMCVGYWEFGQRMTHARGGVSDTLPWGSNPASPPAGRQDGGCWVPFTCQAALVRCDVQTAGAGGGWPLTR